MITMSGIKLLALFLVVLLHLEPIVADSKCIEEERKALLVFKQGLVDESGSLSSWGSEDDKKDCCKWRGVRCSNQTGNVIVLNLQVFPDSLSKPLKGTINPSLLKLHQLRRLDLRFNKFSGSQIPEFIGSLSKLKYLYLSGAEFSGPIPHHLGNLSELQLLDLGFNDLFSAGNLEWLSHLSSIRYLDLSEDNLSESTDWLQVIDRLRFLTTLYLKMCDLPPIIPSSLSYPNSSKSLQTLDLALNDLTSSIYPWLFNLSGNLIELALDSNHLHGSIPYAFGNMVFLQSLSLSGNNLEGVIPNFFENMCSLYFLDLSSNNLSGRLSTFIQNLLSGCDENLLAHLYLGSNEITGSLPDFTRFSSLSNLHIEQNRLNGTITNSIGQLSKLEVLSLGGNSLRGVISEAFFSNLSSLTELHLADNSLTLELSHDWIPPFQLNIISLGSCKMGPQFPKWLQNQKHFYELDISNAGISYPIPDWFWNLSRDVSYLNLSRNQMQGRIPKYFLSSKFNLNIIDISSNLFEGSIPLLPSNAFYINLSKNKFSGMISFSSSVSRKALSYLDLSSNQLSGRLPDFWMPFTDLHVLDLANNGFSGKIPSSMSFLSQIVTLSLRNNNLYGELPSFFKNCTQLRVVDLDNNALSGNVPAWIGESLQDLVVLSLGSNRFYGEIPLQLCYLKNIQILDLSLNDISGTIPKCFSNFSAMTQERSFNSSTITSDFYGGSDGFFQFRSYIDNVILTWKGSKHVYKNTLGLVKILDLSSNMLGGEVLEEIMDLVGLIALNLSRNNFTGQITPKIGQLELLDFLDLSRNKLFGGIPSSLSELSRLSVMDLSYNNLSGKIPSGTQLQSFNASVYAGNLELCGLPLPNKCPDEAAAEDPRITGGREDVNNTPEDEDQLITLGFYVGMILGFVAGFWGVSGTLLLNSSWRHAYFNFLTGIKDWLHVKAALNIAKLKRRFSN